MDENALPDDFFHLLRNSIKPSETLVGALADTGGLPQSDHIRKIIAAVIWHRKFVLTYYIWIVAVVIACCGHKTYKRRQYRTWSKRREEVSNQKLPETSTSSSSSSTLNGTNTPPQKDFDIDDSEVTPLIPLSPNVSQRQRPSVWNRLASFLLSQPDAIPSLTSPRNTLPDNGTTILILFFFGLNLFYLFYAAPLELKWIFILIDRAGLLFVVNLPVLYVLAAKNNQPIKYLTGWSYEGLNIFHRRLGEWMTCFAAIHMVGMVVVWYTILRPFGFTLLRYLTTRVVLLGLLAVASYYTIYITSVGWFRALYYEVFLGLHIFFQVTALVFLFFHYHAARPYVGAALAIWVIDRGVWRIATSTRKFIATLEIAPDGQTVLLHADIPLYHQQSKSWLQPNLHYGWAPGQHVFLTIPSMGFKYRFQAHPFTIASPAPPRTRKLEQESWHLQLTIRAINGFSRDLLKFAKLHQHCEIALDGPYGSPSALEAAQAADRVCFVAGGSGIAVTYPLAWDLRSNEQSQSDAVVTTRIIYANGVRKPPPHTLPCGPLTPESKYTHIWVRQDDKHEKWITMLPKASAVKQDSPPQREVTTFPTRSARAYWVEEIANLVTRTFDTRARGSEGGRPDMQAEVYGWVTSTVAESKQSQAEAKKDKICVIVSGPDDLVRDVRNVCAELVSLGWRIDVHVEKFGW